jgi:hypothetical protein
MTQRRIHILACLLLAILIPALVLATTAICRADAIGNTLSASDYRAELDRLLAATQQLDSSGGLTPAPLHDLPQNWHIHTEQGDFDVSSEGLRRDVSRYEREKNVATALAVRERIKGLCREIDGFEKPAADVSAQRADLNAILGRPEFHGVHGPTRLDRLKQWMLSNLLRLLGRAFGSSAFPTISRYFVYGLSALALVALAYFVYRTMVRGTDAERITPADLPVSAKEWAIWLAEARSAAAKHQWRDAIHLAYWAGIAFLERQGMWRPDRARTPREYLRLLSVSSEHRETLTALTRTFELAWYAKRDADEHTFAETLQALEKLGCR